MRGSLPIGGRLLRAGALLLGAVAALVFVTLPMRGEEQAVLTLGGIAAFLLINRWPSRRATLVLVFLSILTTARYLFWRASDTLETETLLQGILGVGLLAAEAYAGILLLLAYVQTAYPLQRKPVPLPDDTDTWPSIDVFVPSYNEALELVRPTVLAAMNMDWPRDRMKVWILDDGRREDFRAFAEACGCGYIVRPDNHGAKAGNINHALKHTDGKYVAIFDCDHAPTRAFLQMTVGWLERDGDLAMVQTPHHFYSPDPFERNLARGSPVPNEGLLFYGLIQQGNDLWNAAFFCGSCAVLRRRALEEVGGVPHVTVTEDCHCSFLMQKRGWSTAYLRLPLAAGLATERLGLHVGQRLRWARGMIQILRLEWTPFARGLSLLQRTCYFTSSFSFLFALPRLVFLTAPLAFLFFGQNIIAASPLAILAYAGSHMFHTFATTARLNGRNRHSFWSEVYEATMALPLLPVTLLTLWDPRKGKFNVTDKGGTLDEGFLDLRVVWPNLTLLFLLLLGFGVGVGGILTSEGLDFQAYALNTLWCGLCLVPVSAAVAVGRERQQSRARARSPARVAVDLVLANGERISAHSEDLSLSGVRLKLDRPLDIANGDAIRLAFRTCGEVIEIPSTLLRWDNDRAHLRFLAADLATEAAIARLFFGRPDAWAHWDQWPRDRPLRSLIGLVGATCGTVFRRHRFALSKAAVRRGVAPKPAAAQASSILQPRAANDAGVHAPPSRAAPVRAVLQALLLVLLLPAAALAQAPVAPPPAAAPPTAEDASTREVRLSLRTLGLRGPMRLRGTSDLQGVLFGIRADEVVTAARLSVSGAVSPNLIASLSQIAVTLNEQAVGTIAVNPGRPSFGPTSIELDPLFFTELNRLNFQFSGRYAVECNDPLSTLLWANISDLSTLTLQIAKLPQERDLSRLPEPFFDRRVLRTRLTLPFILPESSGPGSLRAAAVAASWFAVLADYRGSSFPVGREAPARGNAVLVSVNGEAPPGIVLPRIDGPTLLLVPNPSDALGTILVIAGRTEAEAAAAATTLSVNRSGLTGEAMTVPTVQPAPRQPYAAPRWLPPDGPVRFGSLVDRADLQANGYAPGAIRLPLRTAPDLYTWRNGGLPVDIRYRAPPGPVVDTAASRLDASVSDTYLRSFPLGQERGWALDWLLNQVGLRGDAVATGRLSIPPYLLLGQDELQLRFDMRPLARGDCAATPGDIHAGIDPDSTIDISRAHRYARMPNLGFFASAGFPFSRLPDLSGTAILLPERPTTVEAGGFLDMVGFLSGITGAPATGLAVVHAGSLQTAADRDLLVIGALNRQPALPGLLRDGPLQVAGGRLTLSLPDPLQDVRALFLDAPSRDERTRSSAALDGAGEGMGILIGLESAARAGRSVVAVTGMTPAAVAAAVDALRAPETSARVKGDVVLVQGGEVSAFRAAPGYDVGSLPFWLWPQRLLGDHPLRAALLLLAAASLLGLPMYWLLRRRAAMRLRARAPQR